MQCETRKKKHDNVILGGFWFKETQHPEAAF